MLKSKCEPMRGAQAIDTIWFGGQKRAINYPKGDLLQQGWLWLLRFWSAVSWDDLGVTWYWSETTIFDIYRELCLSFWSNFEIC